MHRCGERGLRMLKDCRHKEIDAKFTLINRAIIDVKLGNTNTARARGLGVTASSTHSGEAAAEACAQKVFGKGNFTLGKPERITCSDRFSHSNVITLSYLAKRKEPS
jgi:hypothetical protein